METRCLPTLKLNMSPSRRSDVDGRGHMPQIIVTADATAGEGEAPIMFRERVTVDDFQSQHFANQLVERLGWAVGDADEIARRRRRPGERRPAQGRMVDAARRELAVSGRPAPPAL
jgi:hypothetical protein